MNQSYSSPLRAWMFLAPTLIVLSAFVWIPAIQSLYLSFFEVAPFTGERLFVGFDNYSELVSSEGYWRSMSRSLLFVIYTVPTSIFISLALALALDAQPYIRAVFRTIFLLPVGVSSAMAAMLWVFLFNPTAGYLNYLLSLIGVTGPNWLADPAWALLSVSIATVWKEVGFNIIFFIAGLSSVPNELKEAALMDGAGPLRRIWHVTLPMISPTLFFVVTVSVIHALESFGQIHILTKGGPAEATNVLVYNLYRDGFENFRSGFASAQAVILFALMLILTKLQNKVAQKRVHYQ